MVKKEEAETAVSCPHDDMHRSPASRGSLTERSLSLEHKRRLPTRKKSEVTAVHRPDGGYGWVVVFGSFMCNFIVDGIAGAFGVFTSVYEEYFNETKAKVALIGSLLIGCYLLTGPIAAGLLNQLGSRATVIIGAMLAGISMILSVFCVNIWPFIILYGVLGGIGFGLIFLPSIVIVGYYFEKKRSIATGISVAGSGFGIIIMPLLCEMLLEALGWKKTVCVLGVITLASIAFGSLYRPLKPVPIEEPEEKVSARSQGTEDRQGKPRRTHLSDEVETEIGEWRYYHDLDSEPFDVTRSTKKLKDGEKQEKLLKRRYSRSLDYLAEKPLRKDQKHHASYAGDLNAKKLAHPMSIKDIFYASSPFELPELQRNVDYIKHHESLSKSLSERDDTSINISDRLKKAADKDAHDAIFRCLCCCVPKIMREPLAEASDYTLLKDAVMLLLCVSNFLAMIGFYVPFVFIIDMAVHDGFNRSESTFLLSVIGIFNTAGRVLFGWLSDRKWISALSMNNFALIISGLLTAICPLLPGYSGLMIYSMLFGLAISAFVTLPSIIIVDELGLDRLTNAFGLLLASRGVACSCGTPIAGLVYGQFNSYAASFYFAGAVILLSGIASSCIPLVHFFRHDKTVKVAEKEKKTANEEGV